MTDEVEEFDGEGEEVELSRKWKLLYPEIKTKLRDILDIVKQIAGEEYQRELEEDYEIHSTHQMEDGEEIWDGTRSLSGVKRMIVGLFEKNSDEFDMEIPKVKEIFENFDPKKYLANGPVREIKNLH